MVIPLLSPAASVASVKAPKQHVLLAVLIVLRSCLAAEVSLLPVSDVAPQQCVRALPLVEHVVHTTGVRDHGLGLWFWPLIVVHAAAEASRAPGENSVGGSLI